MIYFTIIIESTNVDGNKKVRSLKIQAD